MKTALKTASLLLVASLPAMATTKVRLHKPSSTVSGYQTMSMSLAGVGVAVSTSITNTTAGGTLIQATQTGGGTALAWMSEPFSGSATLSGTETCNIYAKEAATGNNSSLKCQLFKYSGGSLGAAFCTAQLSTELSTSMALRSPTCTASSTAFSAGDQLVVELFIVNCATNGCPSGTMGAGTPGVTIDYDGPTASSDGDSNLLLAETVSFNPYGGSGGAPSIVQIANNSDYVPNFLSAGSAGGMVAGQHVDSFFDSVTGASNMLIAFVSSDSTGTSIPTISDSGSNTWYLGTTCNDGTNGEQLFIYYAPNAASTSKVTVTYNSANAFAGVPAIAEVTNVATATPIDGSACGLGATTTVAAGSVTPNYSGDLVLQYAWNETIATINNCGACGVHYTKGNQSNITWAKLFDGWAWAYGAQWGVYNSTSALNPTFTVSTAGFNSSAIFLRSSSAGTSRPAGIYVTNSMNVPFVSTIGTGTPASPLKVYFPCDSSANLIIANYAGPGNSKDLTGVADSNSNTWTSNHAIFCDGGNNTCVHTYRAQSATLSDDQWVNLTISTPLPTDNIHLACIKGAASSPYDTNVTNSGNQTVAGDLTVFSGTVTPSTSNGLVVVTGSQFNNTTSNWTGAGQSYGGCYFSGEATSIGGCAANNPWGFFYNSSTSAETWTAHMISGSTAVAQWAAQADIYKAPQLSSCSNFIALVGVGCQ